MRKVILGVAIITLAIGAVLLWPTIKKDKTAIVTPPSHGLYVALGDSVAAGQGLDTYSDSSACDRTDQAYPRTIAKQLHYTLVSVACSGATSTTGLVGSQNVNELPVEPQINQIFKTQKPALVTITIGANDADWTKYLQKCYTSVCGSDEDTAAVEADVHQATANLHSVLDKIAARYPTQPPRVMVTGYYTLFPDNPAAGCPEITGIDASELSWIGGLQRSINDAIQSATVGYSFANYVPLTFASHELCTSPAWIQGLSANAPYHPTVDGQQSIANQLITAVTRKGSAP